MDHIKLDRPDVERVGVAVAVQAPVEAHEETEEDAKLRLQKERERRIKEARESASKFRMGL